MDDVVIEGCHFIHFATTNGSMGPGYPSIWVTAEGLGSLHFINNFFDGSVTTTNPTYGADGILWEQTGEETVISGNTINNFKLEGIQCGAQKQTISGNIFRASWLGAIPLSLTALYTNVQLIANNIQTGGGGFATDGDTSWNTNATIDATIVNNTVMLGNKDAGIDGRVAMYWVNLRRAVISGNTFDNYADQGVIISGTGKDDSTLSVQGNSFTSMGSYPGSGIGIDACCFRNFSILNNIISSGDSGPIVLAAGTFNAPTNLPGRVIFGNNIYVYKNNATPSKWVRVDNITISTSTTNTGNYVVTDLNPGPF